MKCAQVSCKQFNQGQLVCALTDIRILQSFVVTVFVMAIIEALKVVRLDLDCLRPSFAIPVYSTYHILCGIVESSALYWLTGDSDYILFEAEGISTCNISSECYQTPNERNGLLGNRQPCLICKLLRQNEIANFRYCWWKAYADWQKERQTLLKREYMSELRRLGPHSPWYHKTVICLFWR